jgi:penicillin-binding protein 1A
MEKYGQDLLKNGGLTIYTSMDQVMQDKARKAVKKGVSVLEDIDGSRPQGAMVVMETGSGKIRAVVGGTDYRVSQFNRAIQAKRQPGSAFKPVVFATAFEEGFTPESILVDEPMRLKGARAGKAWQPENFDNLYNGPTTLRAALVQSRNIVAVKLLQEVGIDRVIKMAKKFGISSEIKADLTLALGSSEVSLLEMTGAYGPFANRGFYTPPLLVEKIIDRHGNVLEDNRAEKIRVISDKTAKQMDQLLQEVIELGTGRSAWGLQVAAGGKTGTTDRYMDAWFVGYTRDFIAGVWVGHDRKVPLGRGASGGRVAAPIWLDFMQQVQQ